MQIVEVRKEGILIKTYFHIFKDTLPFVEANMGSNKAGWLGDKNFFVQASESEIV